MTDKGYPGGMIPGTNVPNFNKANRDFVTASNRKPRNIIAGMCPYCGKAVAFNADQWNADTSKNADCPHCGKHIAHPETERE